MNGRFTRRKKRRQDSLADIIVLRRGRFSPIVAFDAVSSKSTDKSSNGRSFGGGGSMIRLEIEKHRLFERTKCALIRTSVCESCATLPVEGEVCVYVTHNIIFSRSYRPRQRRAAYRPRCNNIIIYCRLRGVCL